VRFSHAVALFAGVLAVVCTTLEPARATDFTTYNFDSGRDAWNSNETVLNPGNVPGIQLIANVSLGGAFVDAQPLYLSNESTPAGVTNVVYAATESNTIIAYSPRLNAQVWTHGAYAPGPPVPNTENSCNRETNPQLGITGTPVIDTTTDTMYFVTDDIEGGNSVFRLHAISPGTGAEKSYSAPYGAVVGPTGSSANYYKQRPALTLANGMIYVAFGGSGCDFNMNIVSGQLWAYSASTLQLMYGPYYPANPGGNANCGSSVLDSIWMSGNGPAVDPSGNIYIVTGNGCVNYPYSFGQSLLRLTPQLTFPTSSYYDSFQPNNVQSLNSQDLDYGSGGVAYFNGILVSGGKDGVTWVHNANGILGGYCYNPCLHYQAYSHNTTNGGLWGSSAVFTGTDGNTWIATGGNGSATAPAQTGIAIWEFGYGAESLRNSSGDPLPSGGTIPEVTSNGTTSGTYVVWLLKRPPGGSGGVTLVAYNAETMQLLTTQPAGTWSVSTRQAILAPAIADGYVMVANSGSLYIYTTPGNFSSVRPSSRRSQKS
jgi:hypothetical protein